MSDFYSQMGIKINQTTFNQMDKNGDGKITREEKALFDAELTKSGFDKFDLNGDGVISKAEQQQSSANAFYEKNKLVLPKNNWKRVSILKVLVWDYRNFNLNKAVQGKGSHRDIVASRIKGVFHNYAGLNLDFNVIKKVLQNMPQNADYRDLGQDGSSFGTADSAKDLESFIDLYNKTLKTISQKETQSNAKHTNILSGINQDAMTMDENGNLILKSDLVKDKTAKTNTEKIDYDTASKVMNGLNGKLKNLAENHYTLKKIKFNEELFNNVFSSAKLSILNKLNKGEITNANQILENFVSEFNSKWLESAIVDISKKNNN